MLTAWISGRVDRACSSMDGRVDGDFFSGSSRNLERGPLSVDNQDEEDLTLDLGSTSLGQIFCSPPLLLINLVVYWTGLQLQGGTNENSPLKLSPSIFYLPFSLLFPPTQFLP